MDPMSQELQLLRVGVAWDNIFRDIGASGTADTPVKGVKGSGMLGHRGDVAAFCKSAIQEAALPAGRVGLEPE